MNLFSRFLLAWSISNISNLLFQRIFLKLFPIDVHHYILRVLVMTYCHRLDIFDVNNFWYSTYIIIKTSHLHYLVSCTRRYDPGWWLRIYAITSRASSTFSVSRWRGPGFDYLISLLWHLSIHTCYEVFFEFVVFQICYAQKIKWLEIQILFCPILISFLLLPSSSSSFLTDRQMLIFFHYYKIISQ